MTDFLGGGLVFAIAAVLWVAYLVPSWLRRRNFMATQANTVRLQQTIRILSEQEDAPETIRAEVSGRGVHEQHKALREAEAKARAAVEAHIRAEAAAAADPRKLAIVAAHRRRTQRLVASVVLLISVLTTIAGITLLGYTGTSAMIFAGAGGIVIALVALRVLASRPRVHAVVAPTAGNQQAFIDRAPVAQAPTREWTPQALPRPLHLEPGSLARVAVDSQTMAARLRQAAQEEALRDRMERAAELNRGRRLEEIERRSVPVQPAAPVAQGALSELAALAEQPAAALNFDELYRRRAVGQ